MPTHRPRGLLGVLDQVVYLYQVTLSPDHSWARILWPVGVCRWQPTCSVYMRQAMAAHGWLGVWLGLKRISRCHPWSKGGFDPV